MCFRIKNVVAHSCCFASCVKFDVRMSGLDKAGRGRWRRAARFFNRKNIIWLLFRMLLRSLFACFVCFLARRWADALVQAGHVQVVAKACQATLCAGEIGCKRNRSDDASPFFFFFLKVLPNASGSGIWFLHMRYEQVRLGKRNWPTPPNMSKETRLVGQQHTLKGCRAMNP